MDRVPAHPEGLRERQPARASPRRRLDEFRRGGEERLPLFHPAGGHFFNEFVEFRRVLLDCGLFAQNSRGSRLFECSKSLRNGTLAC